MKRNRVLLVAVVVSAALLVPELAPADGSGGNYAILKEDDEIQSEVTASRTLTETAAVTPPAATTAAPADADEPTDGETRSSPQGGLDSPVAIVAELLVAVLSSLLALERSRG